MRPLRYLLLPLAWLYGAAVRLRAMAYRKGWKQSYQLPAPIISVGNITVGGTGKTPMAAFLMAELGAMNLRPAYLSRGYGRKSRGYLSVDPHAPDGLVYGDEAFLMACRFPEFPVAVCEDRVEGVKCLLAEAHPDIVILDDAFQHLRIQRDLDLVMVDATRLPTRDLLLPAGRLREPLAALRRADYLILSKYSEEEGYPSALQRLDAPRWGCATAVFQLVQVGLHPFFPGPERPVIPIEEMAGMEVVAFSGLGNNAYFASQLKGAGAVVGSFLPFPDHHDYSPQDFGKILEAGGRLIGNKGKFGRALILTTEKDFYRLKSKPWLKETPELPLYYVAVEMEPVQGWEAMRLRIEALLKSKHGKS